MSGLKFKRADRWAETLKERVEGIYTEQDMQKTVDKVGDRALELTPVDTGNLRDSQYRSVEKGRGEIVGTVGYWSEQAPYAIYVHEIDKNYIVEGTQWKFLETAFREIVK